MFFFRINFNNLKRNKSSSFFFISWRSSSSRTNWKTNEFGFRYLWQPGHYPLTNEPCENWLSLADGIVDRAVDRAATVATFYLGRIDVRNDTEKGCETTQPWTKGNRNRPWHCAIRSNRMQKEFVGVLLQLPRWCNVPRENRMSISSVREFVLRQRNIYVYFLNTYHKLIYSVSSTIIDNFPSRRLLRIVAQGSL